MCKVNKRALGETPKEPRKRKPRKRRPKQTDGEMIVEAIADAEAMSAEDLGATVFNWGRMKGRSLSEAGKKYVDDLCAWVENKRLETKHAVIYQKMLRWLALLEKPHARDCEFDQQLQQTPSATARRGEHKKWDPVDDCPQYATLAEFRANELVLENGAKLGDVITPFQVERFDAWDNHRRVYCESCTGSSKTTDIAGWCISQLYKDKFFEGTIYAVDIDQAKKISNAARGFINRNIRLQAWLDVDRSGRIKRVTKGRRGKTDDTFGEIVVDSSDVASAEGLITDVVICEQLESWRRVELWESIISRAHKREMKVLVIANACFSTEEWQYKHVREIAEADADWCFIRVEVDQVEWISEKDKAMARKQLRPATYDRLYKNIAGAAEEGMLTEEQAVALVDEKLTTVQARSGDVLRVALALDLGLKRDLAVLSALGEQRNGNQVLLAMQAWQGSREKPVDIEQVEVAVADYWSRFYPNKFLYDPWQFEGSAQRLVKNKIFAEPFEFGSKSISELSRQLWRRCVDCRLVIYPRAGALVRDGSEWDLLREIKGVRLVEGKYGFKIETRGSATKDRVISIGMASWWLASTYIPTFHDHVTLQEKDSIDDYPGKRTMVDFDI